MRFSRFSGLLAAVLAAPPHALWAEPAATLGTIPGSSDQFGNAKQSAVNCGFAARTKRGVSRAVRQHGKRC